MGDSHRPRTSRDRLLTFLDVGAHDGQTLEEVTTDRYDFERIYAFEPAPAQYARLLERFAAVPNVTLLNCGLSDQTGPLPLYGTNDAMEASLYPAKVDVDEYVARLCHFVKASEFFTQLPDGLTVKLNCEGAEVAILDDLIDSGQIWKIASVLIDFDVRKIPGMEHREEQTLKRLADIGFDRYCSWPPGATHQERIRAWLT